MTLVSSGPPSSSVTSALIVYMPACRKAWTRSQPESWAGNDSTFPSSQFTLQIWVSLLPGSTNGAVSFTASPTLNNCHGFGAVSLGAGTGRGQRRGDVPEADHGVVDLRLVHPVVG